MASGSSNGTGRTGAVFRPPGSCGDLLDRLARIGSLYRRHAFLPMAAEVHDLKLAARAWRFEAVESLAHSLEADLAATGRSAIVSAYVERMADAIACEDVSPAPMDAMIASVRARMLCWTAGP